MRAIALVAVLAAASCATPSDDADAEARYQQARDHFEKMRYDQAAPLYERVIGKRPMLRDAYHDLGVCYEKLGRDSEAIRIFEKAISNSDSHDEIALRRLGQLFVRKAMYDAAIATYKKLEKVEPGRELQQEISRLEVIVKSKEGALEAGRQARAKARFEEMAPQIEQMVNAKRYSEAIAIIDTYPSEFRDTTWWTIDLKGRRTDVIKLMEK